MKLSSLRWPLSPAELGMSVMQSRVQPSMQEKSHRHMRCNQHLPVRKAASQVPSSRLQGSLPETTPLLAFWTRSICHIAALLGLR